MAELYQHAFRIAVYGSNGGCHGGHQTNVNIQLGRRHGEPSIYGIGILGGISRQISDLLGDHLPVTGRGQPRVVAAFLGDDGADLAEALRIPQDGVAVFILVVDADGGTLHAVGTYGLVDEARRVDQGIGAFHFVGCSFSQILHRQIKGSISYVKDQFILESLGLDSGRIILPMLAVFIARRIPREVSPVFLRHFIPYLQGFFSGNITIMAALPNTVTLVTLGAEIPLHFLILFDILLQFAEAGVEAVDIALGENTGIAVIVETKQTYCVNRRVRKEPHGVRQFCRRQTHQLCQHMGGFQAQLVIVLITQGAQLGHGTAQAIAHVCQSFEIQRTFSVIIDLFVCEHFVIQGICCRS